MSLTQIVRTFYAEVIHAKEQSRFPTGSEQMGQDSKIAALANGSQVRREAAQISTLSALQLADASLRG